MRWLPLCAVGLICVVGCAGRKSSLLLERQARGLMDEEPRVAQPAAWRLDPVMQTQTKGGVEVLVNHASRDYLKNFFSNAALFQSYAGTSPFFPENLVFYVKIANRSDAKIRINPAEFTLLDDRGNQYATVGVDYVTAFAEYRQPVGTTTRDVLGGANPGYFGFSLPVGRYLAKKPQGQFAQLQQSSLQPGYLFPGVIYDGLIAFWNPSTNAKKLRLLLADIKSDFDANDVPKTVADFVFDFTATKP